MVGVVMYFCPAARNLPACKGKSLRCLRKCRFSYIGTSPAPSARRHLTAALRYSACPPHRPSCLHLGCQTHQTWCAPRHLGAAPCQLVACSARPIQNFRMDYGCNRRRMARRRAAPGTACEAVRCSRAGCEAEGRLCCEFEVKRQKTSTSSVSVREPPSPAQAGPVLDHSSRDEARLNGRTFTQRRLYAANVSWADEKHA